MRRRHLKTTLMLGALAAASLAFGLEASPEAAAEADFPRKASAPLITAVDGVEVVVRDLERSQAFFRALGFSGDAEEQLLGAAEAQRTGIAGARVRRLQLTLGSEHLALLQYVSAPGRAVPADTRGNDLWFQHVAIVVSDMDRAFDWLRAHMAGESENYGPEQEHLNGVFGARLRITALRAARGPGIELLEYLAPHGGRALPRDARANDLWHWQVVLSAADSVAVATSALSAGGRVVSQARAAHEVLVRDPDGHALLAHDSP